MVAIWPLPTESGISLRWWDLNAFVFLHIIFWLMNLELNVLIYGSWTNFLLSGSGPCTTYPRIILYQALAIPHRKGQILVVWYDSKIRLEVLLNLTSSMDLGGSFFAGYSRIWKFYWVILTHSLTSSLFPMYLPDLGKVPTHIVLSYWRVRSYRRDFAASPDQNLLYRPSAWARDLWEWESRRTHKGRKKSQRSYH